MNNIGPTVIAIALLIAMTIYALRTEQPLFAQPDNCAVVQECR